MIFANGIPKYTLISHVRNNDSFWSFFNPNKCKQSYEPTTHWPLNENKSEGAFFGDYYLCIAIISRLSLIVMPNAHLIFDNFAQNRMRFYQKPNKTWHNQWKSFAFTKLSAVCIIIVRDFLCTVEKKNRTNTRAYHMENIKISKYFISMCILSVSGYFDAWMQSHLYFWANFC